MSVANERFVSKMRANKRRLLLGTLLPLTFSAIGWGVASAQSLPSGGSVVSGQASISSPGAGGLTIDQSSQKAIIDWENFSIGNGKTVQFNNGAGATLNRVTGGQVSSLDGVLNATGSVYLINPNGVIVGQKGVVNVGGTFVGSTLNISNESFNSDGAKTFAGTSNASVVNMGRVGALGGNVVLVGANVSNQGTIAAPNGTASLVAGNGVVMQDGESAGNFLIGTGGSHTSAGNTGSIEAASVQLLAEGGNVFALAGNVGGVIRATGVATGGGKIYLTAGDAGTINIAGSTLSAATANGNGGAISAKGGKIDVASDAVLDVSATSTTGSGGAAVLIANMDSGSLTFKGRALARGGALGGNGGFAETSGAHVDFNGARIDTSAAAGSTGEWLTDPFDLNVDGTAATTISSNLQTTNVTLQTTGTASGWSGPGTATTGSGDININNDISWSSANTLTLDAYRSINISGNLTVSGAGKVVFTTNHGGTGGDYTFYNKKSLQYTGTAGSGQALTINGNNYVLMYKASDMTAQMDRGTASTVGTFAALAKSLDFSTISLQDLPAGRPFLARGNANSYAGTFTGLGNTVSNLNTTMTGNLPEGFWGAVENGGTIRDFGLVNTTINFTNTNNQGVGSLVGNVRGAATIKNVYSENVKLTGTTSTGGLIGILAMGSTVDNVYVTGSVTNLSRNTTTGNVGGLIGTVSGGSGTTTIRNAYSTASVLAASPVSVSTIAGIGGLIGNVGVATPVVISNVYATGNVTAAANGNTITNMGGLIGIIGAATTVTNAWASGAVGPNSTTTNKGQLFGTRTAGSTLTNVSNTSDSSNTLGTVGSGTTTGITSKTRAQLQLGNFDPTIWSVTAGFDPYLNRFATRNGLVGTALNANGSVAADATVNVYYSGFLGNTVRTAADGTYSTAYFTPTGVAAGATAKPGLTLTLNGAGAVSGAIYNDAVAATGLKSGSYTFGTTRTTLSAVRNDIVGAFGTTLNTVQNAGSLNILAGNGFTIDGAISQTGSVFVQAGGGNITLASGGSVSSAASGDAIILAANGNFLNNNPSATALSATNGRWLVSSLSSLTSTTGALAGKSYYDDAFDFETSTFNSTPNGGNRFVYANAPVLTVTADTKSVTYNGLAQTDTYTLNGYLTTADRTSDSFTGSVTGLTTPSKNAGSIQLTPSGTLVSDENYAIKYQSGTLTINKASLTYGLTGTASQTYDGTTVAKLGAGNVALTGVFAGDTVTASGTGTLDNKNVGTGKGVTSTAAGLTLAGVDAANYSVTGSASGNIATVTKANLGISASSDVRQYNATTSSSATPWYDPSEVKGTDTITGLTQAFDNANAGDTRVLTVTGFTINDGNGGNNYNVTLRTANGRITTVPITNINWSVANGSSTYGTTPVLGAATLTGILAQDAASVSAVVGLFKGVDQVAVSNTTGAGTYSERVTGLTGSAANNYSLLSTGNTSGIYIINPKVLSASLIGSISKTYDATTLATLTSGNFSALTGVLAGDTVTLNASTSGAFADKNAGSGKTVTVSGVTLAGASAANYTIASSVSGNIGTITPKSITAGLLGTITKTYDGTTAMSLPAGQYAFNGIIGGDNLTLAGTGAYSDKNAAKGKTVNFTNLTLGGTDAGNYSLATASLSTSTGVINKKALTPGLVGTVSKVYDGTIVASLDASNYTLSGFVTGDVVTVSAASKTYADRNAGTGKTVNVSGLAISGADAANYKLVSTTASGTIGVITPKLLTGTLVGSLNKPYDGTSAAAITLANYSVLDGIVGTDNVKIGAIGSASYFDKNQGTGKLVTSGPVTLTGTDAANYTTTSFAGPIGAIFAIPITVKADDKSKALGDPEPIYTYVVTSGALLGSDAFTGAPGRGKANQGEFAGTYTIDQFGLGVTSNYILTFVPGSLTIADAVDKHENVAPASLSTPTALTADLLALGKPSDGGDVPTFTKTSISAETTPCNGNDKECLARVYPSNRDVSNLISFAGQ